ncbi:MAG TPA: DUF4328 domain-containing protein [Solirubrobacteraceae bacterium]|nr:DUF4328 domain-containing protein [Solirubrobacteraceae bacterium]
MPDAYISLDGRRRAVTIVFGAIVAISVAAVISDILYVGLVDRLLAGEDVSEAEAIAGDDRQSMMAVFQFGAWIAGAIVFIRWLHGAYKNVDVVARPERRYGHGWAIGAWFVPILNLWRPKQIVNDVWRAGGRDSQDAEPGWLLLIWWTAYIVSSFAWRFADNIYEGEALDDLRNGTIAIMVSDGIDVIGAILAILIVRAATDRLDGRAAAKMAPPPQGPDAGWQAPEETPAGAPA